VPPSAYRTNSSNTADQRISPERSSYLLPPSPPAEKTRILLPFAVSSYRLEFIAVARPARYITTAHSSLCYETMLLRGREEGGMALLPVLARSRPATNPSAGRATRICQLSF